MATFQVQHHQIIESALKNFNADFLAANHILFGGGTRIALEIDEYRESVDIDFLCPTRESYRAVRQQVTNTSLGALVLNEFNYAREIRADRDAVRTWIQVQDTKIKLEFVSFNEYQLTTKPNPLFPVPSLSRESCFVTKLLANADRATVHPFKDIYDLLAMCHAWGEIPPRAMEIAESFYGDAVRRNLIIALEHLSAKPKDHAQAAKDMLMKPEWFKLLHAQAATLLQSINYGVENRAI